jgi:hypothetical protein
VQPGEVLHAPRAGQLAIALQANQVDEPTRRGAGQVRRSGYQDVGGLEIAVGKATAVQLPRQARDSIDKATQVSPSLRRRELLQPGQVAVQLDGFRNFLR